MDVVRGTNSTLVSPTRFEPGLYVGEIRHRRFSPKRHEFRMPLFMVLLDPDRVNENLPESLCFSQRRAALAQFRRTDYIAPDVGSIVNAVSQRLQIARNQTNVADKSSPRSVLMLTHLRQFGYIFNPVTIYYELDPTCTAVTGIVAEITNTPWKERHAYALPVEQGTPIREGWSFGFDKQFHVSPFMPMNQRYRWQVSTPGDSLNLHFENYDAHSRSYEQPLFDATLMLERRGLTTATLTAALLKQPFMTAGVIARIHFEALRLWLKRVPVYDHPNERSSQPSSNDSASTSTPTVTAP